MSLPARERFWRHVDVRDDAECWPWTGARNDRHYGVFAAVGSRTGKAHRFAYQDKFGPIPNGLHVLHSCDNPPCVNPRHLFLGTHADNMRDMHRKGRFRPNSVLPRGEAHHAAKITSDDVRSIRSSTATCKALAVEYGLCVATVHEIKHRKIWRHVP